MRLHVVVLLLLVVVVVVLLLLPPALEALLLDAVASTVLIWYTMIKPSSAT